MEQTTQQNIQKPTLPIKTKIAAHLMRIAGVLFFVPIFIIMITGFPAGWYLTSRFVLVFIFLLISFFLFLFFPTFLLKKKKWGWWGSIGVLLLFLLFTVSSFVFRSFKYGLFLISGSSVVILHSFLLWVFVLILLLLDRKNFWKIAH